MGEVPVGVGQELEIEVVDLNHEGSGVGKVDGFTVFVPYALPGELVLARITEVKKRHGFAALKKIVNKSEHRVEPPCGVFYECGGCQLQHMDYGSQLEMKRRVVTQALARIAHLKDLEVKPTIGMKEPWRYRNRVQLHAAEGSPGMELGYFLSRSQKVLPIDDCPIAPKTLAQVLAAVKNLCNELEIPLARRETAGGLRHFILRQGSADEVMVILVTGGEPLKNGKELAERLRATMPQIVGVVENRNPLQGSKVLGDIFVTLDGQGTIKDSVGKLVLRVAPGSFTQVNRSQAGIQSRLVLEAAELTGRETVFDLYCGVGTFSLFLARHAFRVSGIDSDRDAVEDARANASLGGFMNVVFHAGRVEKVLPEILKRCLKPDVIVLDPPRQGCEPQVLDTIATTSAPRLIYVSCDPATLARDLGILAGKGYQTISVQPLDMFPQTSHVETVVLMSRVDK